MDNQKVDISVELSGSVEDVIYKNADNGYTVINLGCDEGLIAVVGNLGDVNEGERLSLRGGWITSPTDDYKKITKFLNESYGGV